MRWWLRLILTLVLAPIVWWLSMGYLATHRGATLDDWLASGGKILPQVYLLYTLPAVVLIIVVAQVERLLRAMSLALATVFVSPFVAWLVAFLVTRYVPEPHVRSAAPAVPLFVAYGLVWGLTIRERRARRPAGGRSDGEFVDALLPKS